MPRQPLRAEWGEPELQLRDPSGEDAMRLVYSGRILHPDVTMGEYALVPRTTLFLFPRARLQGEPWDPRRK